MAFNTLVSFDRPLVGFARAGAGGRTYTESEMALRLEEAYQRGIDSARELADHQMVEFRSDVEQFGSEVLGKLGNLEPVLVAQLREALPALAVEIGRRLLAGFEPPAEVVSRICEEALAELYPERDNLEIVLCPRDASLLDELNPSWRQRYPGLVVSADRALAPGDCQVRSRFGLTDARQQTKLNALAHGLAHT
jgi:flagellar assembly protein FliH